MSGRSYFAGWQPAIQQTSGLRHRFGFRLAKARHRQAFSDMAASKDTDGSDSRFYKPADAFFPAYSSLGLTFDDVTLATLYSEVLPRDTQLDAVLADGLHLNIPIISSDMDTVSVPQPLNRLS